MKKELFSTCCGAKPDAMGKCGECHDECDFVPADETAAEWFEKLHQKLVDTGRIFKCAVCGKDRDTAGCVECEELEYLQQMADRFGAGE